MTDKKLQEQTESRAPPAQDVRAAEEAGAEITGYRPQRIAQFVAGEITLGELEGVPKEAQYKMAETGYQMLNQGKKDEARKIFLGLHAIDPFDAYFLTALGVIAVQKGQTEEALQRFTRALEINPYSIPALVGRGEIHLRKGRLIEAAADLSAAIEQDPEGQDPATMRARALAQNTKSVLESANLQPQPEGDLGGG